MNSLQVHSLYINTTQSARLDVPGTFDGFPAPTTTPTTTRIYHNTNNNYYFGPSVESQHMEEYKLRRGEYLGERVPDLKETIEEYFGPVTAIQEYKGSDLHVVEEPSNPVFEQVITGAVEYDGKKDKLAVEFQERDLEELMEAGQVDAAADANEAKNEFLLECTGRDAKDRRKSLKRSVEDDAETPDNG